MAQAARILFVHHRSELGGAPTSLSYLIRQLDRAAYEPHVYCPPGPAAELFADSGATVHTGPAAVFTHIWASTYHGTRWMLVGAELGRLPGHMIYLQRLLRRERFDLVHLNDSPLLPAGLLARSHGLPIVWHLRSSLPAHESLRSRFMRTAIRRLASATISISEDVAESFRVDGAVIPNAVDLDRFRPGDAAAARAELGLPADGLVIAYFGFVYPSKGVHDVIHAAALLASRGIDATFLIVGGPVRGHDFFESAIGRTARLLHLAANHDEAARRLVSDLDLASLRFLPFTSDPALLYRASEVVVAPSRGPELGRPVIEAAACGRPVVASGSKGGAGIVVPERTGLLVPQRSPDVLAAAIERLAADPDLRARLGRNARSWAEERFDEAAYAQQVAAVYEDVLRRRR